MLAGITWWRGHGAATTVLATLAGSLLLAGVLVPGRLSGVHRAWMAMALAISKVTTPIFMGLVYFLVLTPTGWLRRAFGGDPLAREARDGSYFVVRDPDQRSDLERQF